MTPSHTKGGWNRNIKPASRYPTIFAGRNTHVAYIATRGVTDEEAEANINLIVAAPDLLDIALLIVDANASDEHDIKIPEDFLDRIKKAIKKAKGE